MHIELLDVFGRTRRSTRALASPGLVQSYRHFRHNTQLSFVQFRKNRAHPRYHARANRRGLNVNTDFIALDGPLNLLRAPMVPVSALFFRVIRGIFGKNWKARRPR